MSRVPNTGRQHDWTEVRRKSGVWQQCAACQMRVRYPARLSPTCPGEPRPAAPRVPKTPDEWQVAVNLAKLWLMMDSAKQYGFIKGGPTVHVARCEEMLRRGAALGYKPIADAEELVRSYCDAWQGYVGQTA